MTQRASIAALLQDLDRRSPAGLAIALHIRFTRPTFLFQTYSKRWTDRYSATGMVVSDPLVRWGLHNVGRIRWADLEPIDTGGVLEAAKDYGLMNGACIAMVESGSRTIAGFARADRDYEEAEVDALEVVLTQLHRATLGPGKLGEEDQQALTDLSIRLTR